MVAYRLSIKNVLHFLLIFGLTQSSPSGYDTLKRAIFRISLKYQLCYDQNCNTFLGTWQCRCRHPLVFNLWAIYRPSHKTMELLSTKSPASNNIVCLTFRRYNLYFYVLFTIDIGITIYLYLILSLGPGRFLPGRNLNPIPRQKMKLVLIPRRANRIDEMILITVF